MSCIGDLTDDTFKILLATDCHLGYLERDAVRGMDSIITFEEILALAVEKKVDFILLGGDLFHENKPSRKVLHDCMSLLRKYCMGDQPVQFEFVSDQSENFKHSKFPVVNYEDPNINISIPVFSIHGNHDDPAGMGSHCPLDLLSACGLVNYFGKCIDLENVLISPLLLQKGNTKVALYGLGSVRDERLHRLFREGKVSMLRPRTSADEWFNLFVLHQNRTKHGITNYIPEEFLDDFLDLIVWGHEHECRIKAEWNAQQSFYVSQPGSSVATSLCHGEAVPKNVGLLEIRKKTFKITEIPLQTVRRFYIQDIDLDTISLNMDDPDVTEKVIEYCKEMVDNYLKKAERELSGHLKQPKTPLIRLRIYHSRNFETFSVQRFGHGYVDKLANSKDILHFCRKKVEKSSKEPIIDSATLKNILKPEGFDKSRVEDLVKEYFEKAGGSKRLSLLSESGVSIAVQEYVDKEVKEAISGLVEHQLRKTQVHLNAKGIEDLTIDEEIQKFREERQKDVNGEIADTEMAIHVKTSASTHCDNEDDFNGKANTSYVRGRAKSRRRGRGAKISTSSRTSVVPNSSSLFTKEKVSLSKLTPRERNQSATYSTRSNSKQSSIRSYYESESEITISSDDDLPKKHTKNEQTASKGGMVFSDSDNSM